MDEVLIFVLEGGAAPSLWAPLQARTELSWAIYGALKDESFQILQREGPSESFLDSLKHSFGFFGVQASKGGLPEKIKRRTDLGYRSFGSLGAKSARLELENTSGERIPLIASGLEKARSRGYTQVYFGPKSSNPPAVFLNGPLAPVWG